MMSKAAPESPCISVCVLDEFNCCRGCRRTVSEITRWSRMGSEEQWAVIARLESLRAAERRESLAATDAAGS
jgi:predicted Fe-S protein YdhL (DUF1289 family)